MASNMNRTRRNRVQFFMNDDEYTVLKDRVAGSGLSLSAYLRSVSMGEIPQPTPPEVFFEVKALLYNIANNMNQIAVKAHTLGVVDARRYDESYLWLTDVIIKLTEAVQFPRKEN